MKHIQEAAPYKIKSLKIRTTQTCTVTVTLVLYISTLQTRWNAVSDSFAKMRFLNTLVPLYFAFVFELIMLWIAKFKTFEEESIRLKKKKNIRSSNLISPHEKMNGVRLQNFGIVGRFFAWLCVPPGTANNMYSCIRTCISMYIVYTIV